MKFSRPFGTWRVPAIGPNVETLGYYRKSLWDQEHVLKLGTQFGLDFVVVQIHNGHVEPAQFICEEKAIPAGEFGRFAERKLADLEEPDGEFGLARNRAIVFRRAVVL